jgi:hypothetical protein
VGKLAPEGSAVFAFCDGNSVEERLDDNLYDLMTDGEYYELKALVREVRACPHLGRGCPHRRGGLNWLWRSLRPRRP